MASMKFLVFLIIGVFAFVPLHAEEMDERSLKPEEEAPRSCRAYGQACDGRIPGMSCCRGMGCRCGWIGNSCECLQHLCCGIYL
nr:Tx-295 [Heteropoda pingtungensis]